MQKILNVCLFCFGQGLQTPISINMKNSISKYAYYILAAIMALDGILVRLFLVDTDLGARFKNYNQQLLSSDIIFMVAATLAVIGIVFNFFSSNQKTLLSKGTILISAILITPISLVLAITPLLETYKGGKVGEGIFASIFETVAILGTFCAFAWVVLVLVVILKQTFKLLLSINK